LLTLSKTSFKNVARDSAVDAKNKIFRPIRAKDFLAQIRFTLSLFTWHAIIVAFSIVVGLHSVAKFGHNQLCVYMALLIIRTRALCTTK